MDEQIKTISEWLGSGSINIFGRPFSGKDTQGKLLADLLSGVLIGGGDILRSHPEPEKIEKILAQGGIIPSDYYLEMIMPYLSRTDFNGRPLILSAVGRSHGEEPLIISSTKKSGHPLKVVLYLDISEEEVWKRFDAAKIQHDRGNRSDDQREVLQNRLKKFQEKTIPVIDFYEQKKILVRVDGSLSRDEVTSSIITKLIDFSKSS